LANNDIRTKLLRVEQYLGFKRMEIDPVLIENVTGIHQKEKDKYIDYIPAELSYFEQESIFNEIMSYKTDIESEIEKLNNNLIRYVK
jgi:hypothetical protein